MSVSRSTAPMCSLGARERCCGGLSAAPARCSSPISKETYGGARMASTPSGSTPTPSRQGTTGAPRLKAAVASPATRWISMVPSGAVSLGSPTTCIAPFARVSTSADSSVSLICQHFCCHYVLDSLRPKGHSEMSTICPLSGGMCCKTRLLLAIGFGGEFWPCPCPALPMREYGLNASVPKLDATPTRSKRRPPVAANGREA